jgi:hypothetical protein
MTRHYGIAKLLYDLCSTSFDIKSAVRIESRMMKFNNFGSSKILFIKKYSPAFINRGVISLDEIPTYQYENV